ncbi:PaaX family transcriptional regulator [Herbiconiux moechotypicola]|uniref:PaaX family transcriptional regulator C-terminal domain-containing protein n=1 Tax=Herbiconiux moechotypicola TaxID=637393 RepID=A0ABP5QAI8_9MICO|nr:PaaX family transcriptional regulator C-terminal domain-containing protein [Herbiconiux moechotypicola]MCS5728686.1 PaaX family transcriptional regulator [Herbiconiux moechotypicola]
MNQEAPARGIGARDLLVEFLGAFVREEGDWFAVAPVVALLGEVGIDDSSVRMAVSRLKTRGWLEQSRREGASGYSLTPTALELLEQGDAFIYHSRTLTDLSAGWVIVAFSVPEHSRSKRHALKSRLVSAGFGHAGPGLLIAPAGMLGEARRIVHELEVDEFVDLFTGRYESDDLARLVARGWDLADLGDRYRGFLAATDPLVPLWAEPEERSERSGREALRDLLSVLHEWRTVAYSDPGLPRDLLGEDWPGDTAQQRFTDLVSRVQPIATRYVHARLRPAPEA